MKKIPDALWEFTKGINIVVVVAGTLLLIAWPIYSTGNECRSSGCEITRRTLAGPAPQGSRSAM
jgi:hypothetical protein